MQAALFYQTSLDAYRQAGLADEEARVLALMEESHRASHAEMRTIEVAQEIPATEMEAFLAGVIGATADETLQNIGVEFLLRRNHLEESLARLAAEAPLSAFIPMSIIDGNRVVAEVGSIDDDPMGRLVHHARQHIAFTIPWLARALQRARALPFGRLTAAELWNKM